MDIYFQKVNGQAVKSLIKELDNFYIQKPEPVEDKKGKIVKDRDGVVLMTPELPLMKMTEYNKKGNVKNPGTIDKLKEKLAASPFDTETVIEADNVKIDFKCTERHTMRHKVAIKHLGLPKRWAADVTFDKKKSRWIFGHDGKWKRSQDTSSPIVACGPQKHPHRNRDDLDKLEDGADV